MDTARPAARSHSHGVADKLGVFAAAACAVHCMAAPVILAFAPLAGGIWTSPKTHWVFAAISIPAALSLLYRNLRGRSVRLRRGLIGLACVGSAFIVLGLAAPGAAWSQGLGVELPCPSWMPGGEEAAASGCTDECCASVHGGDGGGRSLFVPIASLVTMLGGMLLVTAHVTAMRCAGCEGD